MTSPSAHQLVQFDWRLITTVGCSSASVIPRSEPAGMPLLQLQFDTANRSQLASQEVETKNYFTKFPSSPEINNGLRPADDTLLWELNVTEVEEVISRLQGALAIADKNDIVPKHNVSFVPKRKVNTNQETFMKRISASNPSRYQPPPTRWPQSTSNPSPSQPRNDSEGSSAVRPNSSTPKRPVESSGRVGQSSLPQPSINQPSHISKEIASPPKQGATPQSGKFVTLVANASPSPARPEVVKHSAGASSLLGGSVTSLSPNPPRQGSLRGSLMASLSSSPPPVISIITSSSSAARRQVVVAKAVVQSPSPPTQRAAVLVIPTLQSEEEDAEYSPPATPLNPPISPSVHQRRSHVSHTDPSPPILSLSPDQLDKKPSVSSTPSKPAGVSSAPAGHCSEHLSTLLEPIEVTSEKKPSITAASRSLSLRNSPMKSKQSSAAVSPQKDSSASRQLSRSASRSQSTEAPQLPQQKKDADHSEQDYPATPAMVRKNKAESQKTRKAKAHPTQKVDPRCAMYNAKWAEGLSEHELRRVRLYMFNMKLREEAEAAWAGEAAAEVIDGV